MALKASSEALGKFYRLVSDIFEDEQNAPWALGTQWSHQQLNRSRLKCHQNRHHLWKSPRSHHRLIAAASAVPATSDVIRRSRARRREESEGASPRREGLQMAVPVAGRKP